MRLSSLIQGTETCYAIFLTSARNAAPLSIHPQSDHQHCNKQRIREMRGRLLYALALEPSQGLDRSLIDFWRFQPKLRTQPAMSIAKREIRLQDTATGVVHVRCASSIRRWLYQRRRAVLDAARVLTEVVARAALMPPEGKWASGQEAEAGASPGRALLRCALRNRPAAEISGTSRGPRRHARDPAGARARGAASPGTCPRGRTFLRGAQ